MPYDKSKMEAVIRGESFTWWRYETPDTLADVDRPGYFDEARGDVRSGDTLTIRAANGGNAVRFFALTGSPSNFNVEIRKGQ